MVTSNATSCLVAWSEENEIAVAEMTMEGRMPAAWRAVEPWPRQLNGGVDVRSVKSNFMRRRPNIMLMTVAQELWLAEVA